jgi:hypothetical protein
MKTEEHKANLKALLELLPHAFDSKYWKFANTTYKEELVLAWIKSHKIEQADALDLVRELLPDSGDVVQRVLLEEYVECNGRYGEGFIGTSFYGSITNEYVRDRN